MQPLKNVELLRKGPLVLPDGETLVIDDKLLDQLVETYDPINSHEAPVCLGHDDDVGILPKHDGAPAHGWLLSLRRVKDSLFGDFEISDELANWIKEKLYKKLSVSFYTSDSKLSPGNGKAYMRHVAMLGASPPVVKGLQAYSLSEQGTVMTQAIEMQDTNINILEQNAANWLRLILADGDRGFKDDIVSFNPEPSAENNYLADTEAGIIKGQFLNDQGVEFNFLIEKTDEGFSREFRPANAAKAEEQQKSATGEGLTAEEMAEQVSETEPTAEPETEQIEELEMTEQAIIDAQNELNSMADMESQLNQLKEENRKLREMQGQMEMMEIRKFSEALFASGKLAEGFAKQEEVFNFMLALSKAKPIVLSEGSNASSPLAWFQAFVQKLPNVVELGEMAVGSDKSPMDMFSPANTVMDDDSAKLHKKVISFCEANNLDIKQPLVYRTALKEVIKTNGIK